MYQEIIIIIYGCVFLAPITVGYEMREYQTPAANESAVELCAVITSPSSNGFAVRAFVLVATLQTETRGMKCYNMFLLYAALLC